MILIFLKYFYGRSDKRYIADTSCLLLFHLVTTFSNPHLAIVVLNDFSAFQLLCINKSKTCETTKWQVITFRKNTEMKT